MKASPTAEEKCTGANGDEQMMYAAQPIVELLKRMHFYSASLQRTIERCDAIRKRMN